MSAPMWIDGHLDLAYVAVQGADLTCEVADPAARCVSLPALRRGGVDLVFGTIFTGPGEPGLEGYPSSEDRDGAERAGRLQLSVYGDLMRRGAIRLVMRSADLDAGSRAARPGVVLLMEGADPIRNADAVSEWHAAGLRVVGLTWAVGTRYAGGNATGGGLTAEGRDLVAALDAHRIVHDVSHLSEQAFDDLMACTSGRVVATHSNPRACQDAGERALTDAQIRELAGRGAVIGLNLFRRFLAPRSRRATIDDAVRHVEHVVEVMGHRRGVGLGSDMDGGFGPDELPEGLDRPEQLGALATALAGRGWSPDDVAGFAHGNWMRVLRESLPA